MRGFDALTLLFTTYDLTIGCRSDEIVRLTNSLLGIQMAQKRKKEEGSDMTQAQLKGSQVKKPIGQAEFPISHQSHMKKKQMIYSEG